MADIQCAIDSDLLAYEVAATGQFKDENTGEIKAKPFETVVENLKQRISEIEGECWATMPSIFFLTGDEKLQVTVNRLNKLRGDGQELFKPNFRLAIAKRVGYKIKRDQSNTPKPIHLAAIRDWIYNNCDCIVSEGMEADDLLATYMTQNTDWQVICCSRDKDLKMVPGWHFGWKCGAQEQFGPKLVNEIGELDLIKGGKKIIGTGLKFFYSQLITGDVTDSIPGLPKGGPVLAFKTLGELKTEEEMFSSVANLYKDRFGDTWKDELTEQINLLWMVREITEYGEPVLYKLPEVDIG